MKHYLIKNWFVNSITALLLIITYGISTYLNLLQMKLFKEIINKNFPMFLHWLLIIVCIWGLYFLCRGFQISLQGYAIRCMNNAFREDITKTLLQKNYVEYHSKDKNDYLTYYINNVEQIQKLVWEPFFKAIGLIAQIVWSIIALATLHWSLLVAAITSATIMILIPKLFEERIKNLEQKNMDVHISSATKIKEYLAGFDVLRFARREKNILDNCNAASEEMEHALYRQTATEGYIGSGLGFLVICCQVLINVLIGYLSISGIIIQSALFGGGNLCGAVSNGLNDLIRVRLSLAAGNVYFKDILTIHPDNLGCSDDDFHDEIRTISLKNVSFKYDDVLVLDKINLDFECGKKYALIGESGCGKSTLLKIILGLLPNYTGDVLINGINAKEYSPESLWNHMSYIEQSTFLFNKSIKENITLGANYDAEEVQNALVKSSLDADIRRMSNGIETIVGEDGLSLSGGQKQRIAIARSLIRGCPLLLVDEGTSALDNNNASIVEDCLLSNSNLTLIYISHHLSEETKQRFDQVINLS